MVTQFIADLERPISRVRLENYRPANGSDLDMVVNYFYNLERSEALYPTLQAFEIALGNSIHLTLKDHFQTDDWFDRRGFLPAWQRSQISAARATLLKEKKAHDADRIVAELHFGFWHSMFNSPFERGLWRPNHSALVGQVFPQISRKERNRQSVWDRIDRVRIIRNRVMHYEPIWYRARLQGGHGSILEALYWISPAMHQTIAMCDRFPELLLVGRTGMEVKVQAEIQRRYANP
jgi:hypothetical protein